MTHLDRIAMRMGEIPPHVLVGFSGGCDSTALVLLLEKKQVHLTCVHVHHGMRGEEADADEAFVRDFCRMHDLPLLVYHAQPPEHPSEGWAREARYGFFREAMEQSGAQALVLAHHSDDQAETVLQHLLRGSGLRGLCAMKRETEVQGMRILRPLLGISHHELQSALEEAGQNWREDSSNRSGRYLRNRVRNELLPLMEALAPGASARIAQTASLLAEDEDALAPAEAASFFLLREQLEDVLGTLTPREKKVLQLRFGLEDGRSRTLEEVGQVFGVTRERIRQIEAKALRKLRHPSRSKKLKDYLD